MTSTPGQDRNSGFREGIAVFEQVVKLARSIDELREAFDFFINAESTRQSDLEGAVMRLAQLWQDVRKRVWLLGTLLLLPEPPAKRKRIS